VKTSIYAVKKKKGNQSIGRELKAMQVGNAIGVPI
jgi:hypothetical protein